MQLPSCPPCPSCLRGESSPNAASGLDSNPTSTPPREPKSSRPVDAPDVSQGVADLAEGGAGADGGEDGGHEGGGAGGGGSEGGQGRVHGRGVAAPAGLGQAGFLLG